MRNSHLKYIFLFMLAMPFLSSAEPNYPVKKKSYPFHHGEKMAFTVYFNWGPIWLKTGEAVLTTKIIRYHGKPAFHFEATGNSLKNWDWLFKLKDYYQTYVRPYDLRPLYYEKNTLEGGYLIHNQYYFNYEKDSLRMITEESRKPKRDTLMPLPTPLYDVITATYFLRSLKMDTIHSGDTLHIPVILDGKIFTQNIIYTGRAVLKNHQERLSAFEFVALLSESAFFSGDEAVKVYVSDDIHRYPLFVKANIIVGSIKIYLHSFKDVKVIRRPPIN